MHHAENVEKICSAIFNCEEDASAREAMRSNGRRYLEKNVALYEEIFCALAGDESSRGGQFLRGVRMCLET